MDKRYEAELMINKIQSLTIKSYALKSVSALEDTAEIRQAAIECDNWIERIKNELLSLVQTDNDSMGEDQ